MNDTEQCGETKGNGEPCEYEAKFADGKCGIHSSINGDTQGRPTKFTDERARLAIEAAREGKSKAGCERAAGIGQGTVNDWLEQSYTFETEDGQLASFSQAFAQARAEGESMYIDDGRSEDGDTSFAKFMLSSSYGYQESKKQETELTGEDGGPIEISFTEEVVETPWSEDDE